MTDIKGFRGGSVPPVKDCDVDAFHDFIRWLEDHNYCRIVPCERCYFWGHALDPEHAKVKRCRSHQVDTYHDDYCSDSVEVKNEF